MHKINFNGSIDFVLSMIETILYLLMHYNIIQLFTISNILIIVKNES